MKGKKVTVVFGVLRRALLKKKIRAWRRRIIQAESDKPSRSSQHIQADISFVLPKLFSLCFIFFLFSLDQIINDCKWLIFMLIKLHYDLFIILLLSLYLFLITPTSSFGSDNRSNVVYLCFVFTSLWCWLFILHVMYLDLNCLTSHMEKEWQLIPMWLLCLCFMFYVLLFYVYVMFSLLF